MDCRPKALPLPRQAVLIVNYPDGYTEAFADKNIDVHIARVPIAHTGAGEAVADDVLEAHLPRRYRDLFRRDLLRASGTTRPLTVDALAASLAASDAVAALNALAAEPAEVCAWTI